MSDFPTVGIVGGGQLARMMQQAAISLGVRLTLLADTSADAAAKVIRDVTVGDYRDLATLHSFATACDVVTFDHEHVPTDHLRVLAASGVFVRPGPDALVHAQDKMRMRQRLSEAGVPCPRWRVVDSASDVAAFAADTDRWPVVLKTARGGYDGKGVWVADDAAHAAALLAPMSRHQHILVEEFVRFERELAVIVARSPYGQAAVYPVVETIQRDGTCQAVIAPARGITADHALGAQEAALKIASELDVTGVLAVELFDTVDGVLVNELAMRPHNSGHWTIDSAVTSQFEQHLRAVLDLPLGSPAPRAPHTVMVNIFGGRPGVYDRFTHCLARDPEARIHLYTKDIRPGRKIGHVTVSGDDVDDLLKRARYAAGYLRGEGDG